MHFDASYLNNEYGKICYTYLHIQQALNNANVGKLAKSLNCLNGTSRTLALDIEKNTEETVASNFSIIQENLWHCQVLF